MKFGMPTLVECKDIYETMQLCSECGLDFIEINLSFPQYLPCNLDTERIRREAASRGISFTIHADEMLNPFDFNERVSHAYFDVFRDTIRFAKEISASVINLHLLKGVYVTLPERVILLSDVYFDEYKARVAEFISMCEDEIGDSGLKICIENVDSNPFTESQKKVLPLFFKSHVFGLTLDTGHESALKFADAEVFREYPERLLHMHLHDSVGKSPHLPLGTGEVDVASKLSVLREDATCLIEVKTIDGLKRSVEYLKNNNYMG
jgi:sugar phosphate isomerase/epimerase